MSSDTPKRGFAARPGDAENWIRAPKTHSSVKRDTSPNAFTARITLDVTPATRMRLKRAALEQETTVAEMLRALIDRRFPDTSGEPT